MGNEQSAAPETEPMWIDAQEIFATSHKSKEQYEEAKAELRRVYGRNAINEETKLKLKAMWEADSMPPRDIFLPPLPPGTPLVTKLDKPDKKWQPSAKDVLLRIFVLLDSDQSGTLDAAEMNTFVDTLEKIEGLELNAEFVSTVREGKREIGNLEAMGAFVQEMDWDPSALFKINDYLMSTGALIAGDGLHVIFRGTKLEGHVLRACGEGKYEVRFKNGSKAVVASDACTATGKFTPVGRHFKVGDQVEVLYNKTWVDAVVIKEIGFEEGELDSRSDDADEQDEVSEKRYKVRFVATGKDAVAVGYDMVMDETPTASAEFKSAVVSNAANFKATAGQRVICDFRGHRAMGTVLHSPDDGEHYGVRFDIGDKYAVIHKYNITHTHQMNKTMKLSFTDGDEVECWFKGSWVDGVVIRHMGFESTTAVLDSRMDDPDEQDEVTERLYRVKMVGTGAVEQVVGYNMRADKTPTATRSFVGRAALTGLDLEAGDLVTADYKGTKANGEVLNQPDDQPSTYNVRFDDNTVANVHKDRLVSLGTNARDIGSYAVGDKCETFFHGKWYPVSIAAILANPGDEAGEQEYQVIFPNGSHMTSKGYNLRGSYYGLPEVASSHSLRQEVFCSSPDNSLNATLSLENNEITLEDVATKTELYSIPVFRTSDEATATGVVSMNFATSAYELHLTKANGDQLVYNLETKEWS